MKGIYLTEEGKKAIENRIVELEHDSQVWLNNSIQNIGNPEYNSFSDSICKAQADQAAHLLREILSSATILPVEESWNLSVVSINPFKQGNLKRLYRNGVIIQSKQ
jgi:hypothetical protein